MQIPDLEDLNPASNSQLEYIDQLKALALLPKHLSDLLMLEGETMTYQRASWWIDILLQNKRDPIACGDYYNQKDILKKLNNHI